MADPLLKVRNVDELMTSSYRFLMTAITNLNFLTLILFCTEQDKAVEYLACEIGQKLSVRIAPEKGYVGRTTVKVPMDVSVFDEIF